MYNHCFHCLTLSLWLILLSDSLFTSWSHNNIHSHPLLYFPAFYSFKGLVEGRPWLSSMSKCRAELWENLKALWMIWVPAQLINFAFVPRHLRIPFVALISFAWTIIISGMRGALDLSHKAISSSSSSSIGSPVVGVAAAEGLNNSNLNVENSNKNQKT